MTMSTSSANTTPLPSRRNLIAQAGMLASIGTVGATLALPVLAGEPGPIERMHAEHVRLTRIYDAAIEVTWDAEERYEEPERPRWHPFTAEGGYKMEILDAEKKKCRCHLDDSDKNIAHLRDLISKEFEPNAPDSGSPNAVRARTARRTLAQIETWKAESKRRSDAAGLTQAREAEEQAEAAVRQHAAQIFAIEPTTFRELAFRAAVLLMTWDRDEAEELPDRLVKLAGIPPHHDA